jgi:hypothetical protein
LEEKRNSGKGKIEKTIDGEKEKWRKNERAEMRKSERAKKRERRQKGEAWSFERNGGKNDLKPKKA